MTAYVISEVEMRDPDGFEAHRALAAKTIAQYGGRYIVRGGRASWRKVTFRRRPSSSSNFPRWRG